MAVSPTASSLPGASLQVHEDLWEARDKISDVLRWALFASIWLITLPILFGASLIFQQVRYWAYVDLFLGGALFVATAIWTVIGSWSVQRTMEDWEDQMLPFFYAVRFELLPLEGDDRGKDIWRRYQSLFTSLASVGKTKPMIFAANSDLKFRSEVKGKKGKHPFDVFARDSNGAPLFVRRFSSTKPVTVEDLKVLHDDVSDVIGHYGNQPLLIAAFASGGFADDAVEYARSDDSLVHETPIDLVRETQSGYALVFLRND
jgi:hypothetical protein